MFRVHRLRSLLALLLVAGALCLPPVALAQPAPQVCDCDADGDIDKVDINLIANARGKAASGPTDPRDPDRDNTITAADARTCTQRCTFANCASPTNRPPIADAGPDATVFTDQEVTLDGSDSTDPDGDPLTYSWTFVRKPAGSTAALTGASTVSPRFTPDVDGEYEIQLIVRDGQVNSAPDTVVITTGNAPPVADAGDDRTTVVNTLVTLDGTGSTDINGDALTHSWSLVQRPQGSNATLSSSTAAMPTFTPDLPGLYRLRLVVNDGKVNSQPDEVRITTQAQPNERPVADAGPDQTVDLNATVTLDGSDSHDPDNGPSPLTYSWSITTRPAGSTAVLSSTSAVGPTFKADKAGEYVIQLIVNDGAGSSAPDTVRITTRNTRPVADAGDDQNRNVGDTVALDGTGSFDADGDDLSYQWSFTSRPSGGTATIGNPAQQTTSFVADRPGMYVVQLVVNDGQFDSFPDTATITVIVPTVPSLSINNASITEGNSGTKVLSFTVTLSPAAGGTVTVAYATANGSATTGDADYVAKNATLTYTAGQTSKTVTVTVRGDTKFEPDEAFFVNLSNVSANATIGDGQGVGTITNDDSAASPTVTVASSDSAASEAGTNPGNFAVTRTGATTNSLTVSVSISGSATSGADYAPIATSVTIPAGQSTALVAVTPVNDTAVEGSETVVMTALSGVGYTVGTPSSSTVNIADNDLPTVTVVATDVNASEAGQNPGAFTFTRAGGTVAAPLVVTINFGGTATRNSDYTGPSGSTITIPAGQASVVVPVTPINDTADENEETIIFTIAPGPAGQYQVGSPAAGTVRLADDDGLPTVTVVATDASASEPGTNTGTFTFTRAGPTTFQIGVQFTLGGTATSSADYVGFTPVAIIPAGQTTATITITPHDDQPIEPSETVVVTINPNPTFYLVGTPSQATVTIADDTPNVVTVAATDANAAEAGANTGQYTFSRNGPTTFAVNVPFTRSGTASLQDYASIPNSVTIPQGQASVTLTITPVDDTSDEPDETLTIAVAASPLDHYQVGTPGQATVTIADNDSSALPTVTIEARDADASEEGPNVGVMRIARSGGNNALALPVGLSTAGSSATGSDFTVSPAGTTIPAGAAFLDITFTPVDDAVVEGPQEIVRTINANAAAYIVGNPAQATVIIADNEGLPTVTIEARDADASEEGPNVGVMRIARSGGNNALALPVGLSTAGSSATGSDFTVSPAGTTIPAGAAFLDITFTPVDDAVVEGPQEIVRTINANAAAYIVGNPAQATVIIADNE